MNGFIDDSLVGLALILSAGYAVSSLGPRGLRRRLLGALGRVTARAPSFLGLRRAARWLTTSAEGARGACGGCDGCASGEASAQPSASASPAAEAKVPLANIGRRGSATVRRRAATNGDLR